MPSTGVSSSGTGPNQLGPRKHEACAIPVQFPVSHCFCVYIFLKEANSTKKTCINYIDTPNIPSTFLNPPSFLFSASRQMALQQIQMETETGQRAEIRDRDRGSAPISVVSASFPLETPCGVLRFEMKVVKQ